MLRHRGATFLLVCGIAIVGCAKEAQVADVQGECGDMYGGNVCTWAQMKGADLVEAGATVPIAAIENSPKETEMAWPPKASTALNMPPASTALSGFTHLTTYWESTGHPPGPYLTPHFDFHFYLVSPAERLAIDCKDDGKPAALPVGYNIVDVPLPPDMATMMGVNTLVGLCVPTMGMHTLLATELESKDVFRSSMVVGYYHQKPIFIEPMLTKAMLMEKKSFTLPIPAIAGITGPYPHKFRADFDEKTQSYRFAFTEFAATP